MLRDERPAAGCAASVAAALGVKALAFLVLSPFDSAQAEQPAQTVYVSDDWALPPSGLSEGDQFRLPFVTRGARDVTAAVSVADTDSSLLALTAICHWPLQHLLAGRRQQEIADDVIQVDATVRGIGSQFRAVVSTSVRSARDHTGSNHTNSDLGIPIYWRDGSDGTHNIGDNYQDFTMAVGTHWKGISRWAGIARHRS